jgi:DNA-binding response OmpR family regulator
MADTQAARLASQTPGTEAEFLALTEGLRPQRSSAPVSILVVDDDDHIREVCRAVAAECGMKASDVSTAEEALQVLEFSSVDIPLTDLRLPGTSGLELLKKVSVTHPDVAVVMLTQYGTIDSAVEATRIGAADYVTKPFRLEELRPPRAKPAFRRAERQFDSGAAGGKLHAGRFPGRGGRSLRLARRAEECFAPCHSSLCRRRRATRDKGAERGRALGRKCPSRSTRIGLAAGRS